MNKKRKQRVVILGSGGFVSSAVEEQLKKNNFKVIALSRKKLDLAKYTSVNYLKLNIRVNDIIFFAAADAPVKSYKQFQKNISICSNVCNGLNDKNLKKLVYLSSDAVYSDTKKFITEKSETNPISLHGLMHITREKMLYQSIDNKKLCVVRPTLIFGKKDPHNGYGPNKFSREILTNKCVNIFGKGEELRDHIAIKDVSRLIVMIIKLNKKGIFNLVTGRTYTFLILAKKLFKIFGFKNKFYFHKRKGPKPHGGLRKFDNKKIKKEFKNFKFLKIEEALKQECLS